MILVSWFYLKKCFYKVLLVTFSLLGLVHNSEAKSGSEFYFDQNAIAAHNLPITHLEYDEIGEYYFPENQTQARKESEQRTQLFLIITIIWVVLLAAGFIIYINRRNNRCQLELRTELEKGEMALQQQALQVINLNNHIEKIESKLKEIRKSEEVAGKDLQGVLNEMFVNRSFDKEWERLDSHFSKIHPKFSKTLIERHGHLTQKERRLLSLIRMDLNTREIARVLGIAQRSVVMSRYRLKQKLNLKEEDNLNSYIQMI